MGGIRLHFHYPRPGHHCRFKIPLYCRILNRQWHTDSDVGFTSLPVTQNRQWCQCPVEPALPPRGSSWQWCSREHCRLMARADSDAQENVAACGSSRQWCWRQHCRLVARTNSVAQDNTIGCGSEPTVMLKLTLPDGSSSRQWWLQQHCRFVCQADSDVLSNTTGSCLKPAVPSLPSVISFLCFIVL
jgi:hypothetical protein